MKWISTECKFILQLNISGCECTPTNCEQTTIAFQQLQRSTRRCFADFNYPINDMARIILNNADDLRAMIEQLYKQNVHHHHHSTIVNVPVQSEWCYY